MFIVSALSLVFPVWPPVTHFHAPVDSRGLGSMLNARSAIAGGDLRVFVLTDFCNKAQCFRGGPECTHFCGVQMLEECAWLQAVSNVLEKPHEWGLQVDRTVVGKAAGCRELG